MKRGPSTAPDGHGPSLHEVLEAQVINALGGEHHGGSRAQYFLDSLLGDIHLSLPDGVHLLNVIDHHLHKKLKTFAEKKLAVG